MANFKVKNGLQAGRYLLSGGTETAGSVSYDIAGASYDSVSFSVAGQDTVPLSIDFNNDGTKMYILGGTNDTIYQYTLSTAFDLSTASYDSVSFSVASQDTSPQGIAFNTNGTKLFLIGYANDSVHQYSLSTSFDLSTASYDSVSFSVSGQDSVPTGIAFNSDGTKMYMAGYISRSVYSYSLSTAFDLSTASYDSVSFSVSSEITDLSDITFNNNGTKMFVVGSTNGSIYQYTLSTAFDVSTASYGSVSFSTSSQDSSPYGMAFMGDGTKLYVVGITNDSVYQYSTVSYTQTLDLSTGTTFSFTPSGATTVSFTNPPASGKAIGFSVEINGDGSAITWPTSVKWHGGAAPTATASKEVYAFVTTDGGTVYYGRKAVEILA